MNNKTISSLFVLFAIVSIGMTAPIAFAEHSMSATVKNAEGSSAIGCEPDCFIPNTVVIGVGGMVTFSNSDTAAHTASSGTPQGEGQGEVFDSSLMLPNSTYTTPEGTFDAPGDYPYYCMVHPWMEGLIIVEEESHDDHADEAEPVMEIAEPVMTLTAADISIDVADGAKAGEQVAIDVTIGDSHVTYDIVATHGGEEILNESGYHSHDGTGSHETSALSADASDDNPIDVTVTFQGFGTPDGEKTGPIGLTNSAQAVPEFGTIAAMILAVAIVSIIAVSAKSRLSFMPRI
jgi:predicted secreted protein with PEFG-CTERM motif